MGMKLDTCRCIHVDPMRADIESSWAKVKFVWSKSNTSTGQGHWVQRSCMFVEVLGAIGMKLYRCNYFKPSSMEALGGNFDLGHLTDDFGVAIYD